MEMPDPVFDSFYIALPGVITLFIGLILLLLRFKAENLPTTQVQRWGMVTLAWLFIMNAVLHATGLGRVYSGRLFAWYLDYDMPVIGPTFLIAFSLIFPVPVVRQRRIPLLFLFLALVLAIVVGIEIGDNLMWESVERDWGGIADLWMYVGWFGSLFRWTQVYRKNRANPEVSFITSILIWGVLYFVMFSFLFNRLSLVPLEKVPQHLVFGLDLRQFFAVAIIFLIVHQLYERRGKWQEAEKLHIAMFIIVTVFFLIVWTNGQLARTGSSLGPIGGIIGYLVGEGAILIVRPALILYALLRYQFFGHELKAERYLEFIAMLLTAFVLALFITFFFVGADGTTLGTVGLVSFVVFLVPSYIGARKLISRVIPSQKKLTRKDARDMYFISFHSTLFKGNIDDPNDGDALKRLRKRLRISEKEHNLLLENERLKAREGKPINQIRHVLFVKDTGVHVSSVGPLGATDETVLAGMLTAIRMFVKDAFSESSGDLDTIQYGDQKLLMEWERGYILAVDFEGEIDPTSRVVVGDLLAIIMRRHWSVLNDWEGDMSEVKVVQDDLERLVYNYNKTGTL
jgi:hypothetical protein